MENTLFSIEKGRAMEGAMEDRPSTHTLTMIFGRELWRITYGGKKILHRILQKTPSMEINKRPYTKLSSPKIKPQWLCKNKFSKNKTTMVIQKKVLQK